MKFGKFITFEGGEGSGKSTQSKLLFEYLNQNKILTILTREIGGTPIAEMIREIVVHQEMNLISELLLVMAARSEHVKKIILPALNEGKWVICDRFIDSTVSYQSDSIIDTKKIMDLHKILITLIPDLTIYFDIDPALALVRVDLRADNNKYEAKPLEFHQMIQQKFRRLVIEFFDRIKLIDVNNLNIEEVHKKVIKIVANNLFIEI